MSSHVFLPVFYLKGRRRRVCLRFPGGCWSWRCWRAVDRYPDGTVHRFRWGPVLVVALVDGAGEGGNSRLQQLIHDGQIGPR